MRIKKEWMGYRENTEQDVRLKTKHVSNFPQLKGRLSDFGKKQNTTADYKKNHFKYKGK